MSRALQFTAIGDYLHSPVDDLESCFWVSFWAVSFNKDHIKAKLEIEIGIRGKLATGRRAEALHHLCMCRIEGNYSKSFHYFRPILEDWWSKLQNVDVEWSRTVLNSAPVNAGEEYYLPHFHCSALQGVVDVLEVLERHWEGEISSTESWAPSTLLT